MPKEEPMKKNLAPGAASPSRSARLCWMRGASATTMKRWWPTKNNDDKLPDNIRKDYKGTRGDALDG